MTFIKREEKRFQGKKFGLTLLAVAAATALVILIPPLSGGGMYFLFLTAIVFSSLYGDVRSGAFAAAVSVIICFLFARFSNQLGSDAGSWLVLPTFGIAAGLTVMLCHAQLESEAARQKAESKYRTIFEDAITGIYETTLDGQYVAANPKLAVIFGYDDPAQMLREVKNLNQNFYVQPARRREFAELVEKTGNVTGFESQVYRRDGERIWILENALAVRDGQGRLIGFQGTTIDITARKRAEAELQQAHEELERKVGERTYELGQTNEVLRDEITERDRVESELKLSQQKLRELSAHLQSVREEERKYLARELHDELGQVLTALKMDLSWMAQKLIGLQPSSALSQVTGRVSTTIEIVDMAMEATRKIVAELRPGVLDELGLEAAVEWQVGDFQKRTGINCDLVFDFIEDGLNAELTTTIFRILQECLTNIARHSEAAGARVAIKDENGFLTLEVEDNGRGIGADEITDAGSFGILGMRERALLLGGSLEINRPETGGTRVTVKIPR